jgi:drug/metabolite transporter (DMT)-like permease
VLRIDATIAGLILVSALIHATWNAIVKSDTDRLMSFGLVMLVGAIMGLVALPFVEAPRAEAWPWLLGSVTIHVFYYVFLLRAYAHGDLSHVYPIARGLAPLLVAMLAGRIAGEHLVARESIGLVLVSGGIVGLAFARGLPRQGEWRALIYAVLTGITIAGYSVVDGIGARLSGDPLGYIAWLNLLEGPWVFIVAVFRRRRATLVYLRHFWWRGAAGGVIATIGYGIAIWALSLGAMAHVTALRETSALFGALIGAFILKESFGSRRIAAAAVMVAGLLLMNLRLS